MTRRGGAGPTRTGRQVVAVKRDGHSRRMGTAKRSSLTPKRAEGFEAIALGVRFKTAQDSRAMMCGPRPRAMLTGSRCQQATIQRNLALSGRRSGTAWPSASR